MVKDGNGIFVLVDFFTETVAVLPTGYDDFEEFVKYIKIDTSNTKGKCFCERSDKYAIQVLDFYEAHKVGAEISYTEYVLASCGNVEIEIVLTSGDVIKFQTVYDRFWLDTNHETLKVIRYEEIHKGKPGLR